MPGEISCQSFSHWGNGNKEPGENLKCKKITQHQSLKGEMRPQKTVSFVILEVFENSLKILPE